MNIAINKTTYAAAAKPFSPLRANNLRRIVEIIYDICKVNNIEPPVIGGSYGRYKLLQKYMREELDDNGNCIDIQRIPLIRAMRASVIHDSSDLDLVFYGMKKLHECSDCLLKLDHVSVINMAADNYGDNTVGGFGYDYYTRLEIDHEECHKPIPLCMFSSTVVTDTFIVDGIKYGDFVYNYLQMCYMQQIGMHPLSLNKREDFYINNHNFFINE